MGIGARLKAGRFGTYPLERRERLEARWREVHRLLWRRPGFVVGYVLAIGLARFEPAGSGLRRDAAGTSLEGRVEELRRVPKDRA
jgi:hypothetical protein